MVGTGSGPATPGGLSLDLDRLRELAGAFRDATERTDRKRLPIAFENFPRGSCGEVAPLLGTFLERRLVVHRFQSRESASTWSSVHLLAGRISAIQSLTVLTIWSAMSFPGAPAFTML
jgi:hypothetical protein